MLHEVWILRTELTNPTDVLKYLYVDVWDEISVVTQPDMKTGRRGSQLSVCEYTPFLLWVFRQYKRRFSVLCTGIPAT